VVDKINNQVSHLNYGRESLPPEKLGHEMQYVKAAIDKQWKRFQETLAAAATKRKDQVWVVRPPRQPVAFIPGSGDPSSTSTFTIASFTSFPAQGMTKRGR
jgi:hypothetical protein